MTFSIEFNYLTMTRVSIEIETALSSPQFSVGHLGLIINWLIVFLVLELELVLVSVLELVSVLLVMLVILLMLLMLFMLTILVVISSVDAGVGGVVSFLS